MGSSEKTGAMLKDAPSPALSGLGRVGRSTGRTHQGKCAEARVSFSVALSRVEKAKHVGAIERVAGAVRR